jgi:murein DD-endopeptidase MepM/ murein hydrolase activator NlpD
MGTSGQSTAVHLHFEIWRQGEAIDPRTELTGEPIPN